MGCLEGHDASAAPAHDDYTFRAEIAPLLARNAAL